MLELIKFNNGEAEKAMEKLKGKYEYKADMTVNEVNEIIQELKKNISYYEKCPLFVMTATYYETTDGKFANVVLTIRPAKRESTDKSLSTRIILSNSKGIFDDFVTEVSKWVDYYIERKSLSSDIEKLNEKFRNIEKANNIPFSITFKYGDKVVEWVEDDKVVFGLTLEAARNIKYLSIFNKDDIIAEVAETRLSNTLLGCDRATDFRRSKLAMVEELGIKTKRSLIKLIKQCINRSAVTQRVGLGMVVDKNKGYIGIVSKEAVKEDEIEEKANSIKGKQYLVVDNAKATLAEQKEGKTKIFIYYLFTPYNETTGTVYDIPLSMLFNSKGEALFIQED